MNWDDLKFFLAVSRTGSIRGAAASLGVNHATVSRRINSFEQSLGERLFERSAKGYLCTAIGQEIYREASDLEDRLSRVERRMAGKDKTMVGDIRVTLPDLLGTHMLMPDFSDFCQIYPDIDLQIIDSITPLNLANREADVAFRICEKPPEYLVGRKLANMHRAAYVARNLLPTLKCEADYAKLNWIGWSDDMRKAVGKVAKESPRLQSRHKIMNASLQLEACRQGMGVGVLPCACADNDPELVRIPPYISEKKYTLWILYHPDLRKNAKVQNFVRFMVDRINEKKPLIEGDVWTK